MSGESSSSDIIAIEKSQAEIFKLKMDHFEEIFEWLSAKDLAELSQTCKRMQHVVGYYIKTNYAALDFKFTGDGILGVADISHSAITF